MALHRKRFFEKFLFYFLVLGIAFIIMIPFIWTFFLSFKTDSEIFNTPFALPTEWSFKNYRRALETINIFQMYKNTVIIAVSAEVLSLFFTFMSSFAISRMTYKHKAFRNGIYFYYLLGLGIPVYILLYPIYRQNAFMGLIDNLIGLILPHIALTIPFNTLLFVGYFNGFSSEIEEAAIIDGCGLFKMLIKITLPIVKPIIATTAVFNVIYIWNEYPFAATYLNTKDLFTVSLATSMFKSTYSRDYSGMICAVILIMIPELIFYVCLQKYIISGMTAGAVKS